MLNAEAFFILHPSSFILHPSSFSLQPSSFRPPVLPCALLPFSLCRGAESLPVSSCCMHRSRVLLFDSFRAANFSKAADRPLFLFYEQLTGTSATGDRENRDF